MLAFVKKAIGISHNYKDDVFQSYIDAGIDDAVRCGVKREALDSNLGWSLILAYVKAEIDFEGKGQQFKANYESMRDGLSMSSGYKEQ